MSWPAGLVNRVGHHRPAEHLRGADVGATGAWSWSWASGSPCAAEGFSRDTLPSARSDDTKSIMRYVPPIGTAGVTGSAARGIGRLPSPPAGTVARTLADMI